MSERIDRQIDRIRQATFPLCADMAWLITDSYRQTDGQPDVIRAARAQANFLENLPIFIEDDQMIVGDPASKPMGYELNYWFRGVWDKQGIDELREEHWEVSQEEEANIAIMSEYWSRCNPMQRSLDMYDE